MMLSRLCQVFNNFKQIAVGFNVETMNYKNLKFQVWDLGG